MATVDEVKERAREVLAKDLPGEYQSGVADEADLSSEGGVDSLGFIQVLTKLEAEYDSHIPDDECWDIRTLDDLANAIVRHQNSAGD